MTDILAQLHEEHKARHLRFRAMARIGESAQRALPAPVPVPLARLPMIVTGRRKLPPNIETKFAAAKEKFREIFGPTIRTVQRIVADKYDSTVGEMIGPRRLVVLQRPRAIAMYLCKAACPHKSFPEIGRAFGGRDHTTVLHSFRKIEALMETDADLCAEIQALVIEIDEEWPPIENPSRRTDSHRKN